MIIKPYSVIAKEEFSAADYPALAHFFPFNETSGATVTDVAGGLVITDGSATAVSQSADGHITLGSAKSVISSGVIASPGSKKIVIINVYRGAAVLLRMGEVAAGTDLGFQVSSAVSANSISKVADGTTLFNSTDGLDGSTRNDARCTIIDLGTDGTGATFGLTLCDFDGTTWTQRAAVSLATSAASIDAIEQSISMASTSNPFTYQVWYFNTVPADFKAATLWVHANAITGKKAPYPGWKGKS